jgi:hypothetical protein
MPDSLACAVNLFSGFEHVGIGMMRVGRGSGSLGVGAILLIGSLLAACHDNTTTGAQTATAQGAPAPSSAKALTLSWDAPTQNADGTALLNLMGYRIYYGTTPQIPNVIDVGNPGLTTYVVENLTAGTYYFAVAAYNSAGVESSQTPEVSATVD